MLAVLFAVVIADTHSVAFTDALIVFSTVLPFRISTLLIAFPPLLGVVQLTSIAPTAFAGVAFTLLGVPGVVYGAALFAAD